MFVNYLAQLLPSSLSAFFKRSVCLQFLNGPQCVCVLFHGYVLSLSPGHFSFLLAVLRVRHFRIASVIILIRMGSAQKTFGVLKKKKLIFSPGVASFFECDWHFKWCNNREAKVTVFSSLALIFVNILQLNDSHKNYYQYSLTNK